VTAVCGRSLFQGVWGGFGYAGSGRGGGLVEDSVDAAGAATATEAAVGFMEYGAVVHMLRGRRADRPAHQKGVVGKLRRLRRPRRQRMVVVSAVAVFGARIRGRRLRSAVFVQEVGWFRAATAAVIHSVSVYVVGEMGEAVGRVVVVNADGCACCRQHIMRMGAGAMHTLANRRDGAFLWMQHYCKRSIVSWEGVHLFPQQSDLESLSGLIFDIFLNFFSFTSNTNEVNKS